MKQGFLDAEMLMPEGVHWQRNLTSHITQYTAFYPVSPTEKQQWVFGYSIAS